MDDASVTISCNELHVFDEDAAPFATEPHFAPVLQPPSRREAEEDIAAARDCWLKVIRRFTRAVPGKKHCLRVTEGVTDVPPIVVRRAHPVLVAGNGLGREHAEINGVELDTTDRRSLIIFATETEGSTLRIVSTTIPWLDIVSITFRVRQPEAATPSVT